MQSLAHELSEADKQKMLLEAQKNIDQILAQLKNPHSFVNKIFQTEKKEIINFWAENLETIYNLQDKPITTIANDIVHSLKQIGVHYGEDGRYTYAYDVLPAKYKDHTPNPIEDDLSNFRQQDSTYKQIENCSIENASIIKRVRKSAEVLNKLATALEESHCLSYMPQERQDAFILEECNQWDAVNETAEAVLDKRQSVPEHFLGSFYKCYAIYGVSGTSTKFYSYARTDIEKITQKQSTKTAKGLISKVPYIYEPMDETDAILGKWSGWQCENPKCGKWRVLEVRDTSQNEADPKYGFGVHRFVLKCFACNKTFPLKKKKILPGNIRREVVIDASGAAHTLDRSDLSANIGRFK